MGFSLNTQPYNYIPEWNDNRDDENPIAVRIKPLELGDFWELVKLGQLAAKIIGKDFMEASKDDIKKVMEDYKPYLSKYVLEIQNIDIDGRVIVVTELADRIEFTALLMEIVAELVRHGQVKEADKKKLGQPSSLPESTPISSDGSSSMVSVTPGSRPGNP